MHRLIEKFHLDRFMNSWAVLILDTAISTMASAIVLFISGVLFAHEVLPPLLQLWWICGTFVFSVISFLLFRTHKLIIRHSSLREIGMLSIAVLLKGILLTALVASLPYGNIGSGRVQATLILDTLVTIFALVTVRVIMLYTYDALKRRSFSYKPRKRVLIYGIGDKSSQAREEQSRLIKYCAANKVRVLIAPEIDEISDGKVSQATVRKVKIEDLLGREEIKISLDEIMANFKGRTVMVTGAAGSIGSELCRQLAGFGVSKLILFDNAETPMHNLRIELGEKFPGLDFTPVIGDVRLRPRLDFAFRKHRPDVVFHAAAYKHVPLMEENPCEAILVNTAGTRYVADMCIRYDVEKMVMISTDKAVNPTNVMGCTKRLAEIYVQALGLSMERGEREGRTKFITTRFGNVLGSNGSVIPRFREQIERGGPVTVTDKDITRFFMTIPEACRLVMEAATISSGNQILVFDMGKPVKIDSLARRMIELAGYEPDKDIKIKYTGLRPGEKLYEEVLSNKENTVPTSHERILVAKVRNYSYDSIRETFDDLERLSREVDIPSAIRLMKATVPEYKSQNSPFEKYDIPGQQEENRA